MQQKDKNIKNFKEIRWGLSQKILGVILLLLLLYMIGTMGSAIVSNQKLSHTIDKKFDEAFNEVFANLGTTFNDFEQATKENIRKTSGLFSLEKIWDILLKGHEKYLENAKKEISMSRQGSLDNFDELHLQYDADMNKISDASSKMLDERTKKLFLPLLEKTRRERVDSENILKKNEEALWSNLQKNLELNGRQIDEEVKRLSDTQTKDVLGKMGKANVVFTGSEEVTRRKIEDIKYRAVDSIKKSIQESNRTSIITLAVLMWVMTILFIIISLFLAHSITKPISKIVEVLQKMAKGDIPKTTIVDVESSDEVGVLASTFNEMTVNLQTTTTSIDNLNKEIIERKKTEAEKEILLKELGERQESLEYVNKELDDFTYTVSHDLKEPLRTIDAFSKYVMDDYKEKLDEEGKHYLERIRANAERMKKLIEDLLEISRIKRKGNTIEEVETEEIIDEVKMRLEYAIKQKSVEIIIKDKLPKIFCDRVRLTEVFINLISNAIKYNDKPNPIIEVGCNSKGDFYEFYVKDNGIGIQKEYFGKIFEIFQRLGKREDAEGTGAGLTIVKKIVEMHKGKIWLESKVGEGSTFYFTVPKAKSTILGKKLIGGILLEKKLVTEEDLKKALEEQRRPSSLNKGEQDDGRT